MARTKKSILAKQLGKLEEQLEQHGVQKKILADQFKAYRSNAEEYMTSYVGQVRRLTETMAANNVKITELEQQVGVQHKELAAARGDATGLKASNQKLRSHAVDLEIALINVRAQLAEAQKSVQYRVYLWFDARIDAAKKVFAIRKQRMVNTFLVRRLNKQRVSAMGEAGYIPNKLVKAAIAYWELDKERATETIVERDGNGQDRVVKQTLWRRIRIILGRA